MKIGFVERFDVVFFFLTACSVFNCYVFWTHFVSLLTLSYQYQWSKGKVSIDHHVFGCPIVPMTAG